MPNSLRRWRANVVTTGAATTVDIKAPDAATDFVYVTFLSVQITTHANGKSTTIQDSNGSPVVIAVINDLTVASGINQGQPFVYSFPRGFKLTVGKKLQALDSAAGCVCSVYAEGFQRAY